MKMMQKLFALTTVMSLLSAPIFSQGYCCDDSPAYCNGSNASYLSVLIPVGVVAAVAIVAASTDHHHSSSSSSSSFVHAH